MYRLFFISSFKNIICVFILYNYYLVYLQKTNNENMAKVIHVHLLHGIEGTKQKDWYFSSISAVYTVFTSKQVGATRNYLLHAGLSGNGTIVTKRAVIKQSTLISGGSGATYKD